MPLISGRRRRAAGSLSLGLFGLETRTSQQITQSHLMSLARTSYGATFAGIGIGYAVVCMLTAALILWKSTLQPVRRPSIRALFFPLKTVNSNLTPPHIHTFLALATPFPLFSRASDSSAPSMGARATGNRYVCIWIVSLP